MVNIKENSKPHPQIHIHRHEQVHYVDWPVKNALALTTTRHHPFNIDKNTYKSTTGKTFPTSPFQSFNLGLHVGDDKQTVLNNRNDLIKLLPPHSKIQWLEQIHAADVVTVTQHSEIPIITDAAITQTKGIALAVMTADCLPIILSSKDGDEVAAIHGGWRPLAANIIANTLNKMQTASTDIVAWLGPCIGNEAFEVGEEVKHTFVEHSPLFAQAFIPSFIKKTNLETLKPIKEKYVADLSMIASIQLKHLGINTICSLNHCTYQTKGEYYSYRRDGKTGRMATIICRT